MTVFIFHKTLWHSERNPRIFPKDDKVYMKSECTMSEWGTIVLWSYGILSSIQVCISSLTSISSFLISQLPGNNNYNYNNKEGSGCDVVVVSNRPGNNNNKKECGCNVVKVSNHSTATTTTMAVGVCNAVVLVSVDDHKGYQQQGKQWAPRVHQAIWPPLWWCRMCKGWGHPRFPVTNSLVYWVYRLKKIGSVELKPWWVRVYSIYLH